MQNWILSRLIALVGKKLDGYKTKIGGVAAILAGIVGFAGVMFPDQGLPHVGIEGSTALISGGFTALGLGGKAEKQKAATEAQTAVLAEQNSLLARQNELMAKGPAVSPTQQ